MQAKTIKNKYRILLDGDRLPLEVSKSKVDRALKKLQRCLQELNAEVKFLNKEEEYEVLHILVRMMDEKHCNIIEDDWTLKNAENAVERIREELMSDDDVPEIEDVMVLSDEGFKQDISDNRLWQKVLEDTEEKEVVEEVYLKSDGEILHRKRTIYWTLTDYGRSSRNIKYIDVPTGKHLEKIIENTKRYISKRERE